MKFDLQFNVKYKTVAMVLFYAGKCLYLASEHKMSAGTVPPASS